MHPLTCTRHPHTGGIRNRDVFTTVTASTSVTMHGSTLGTLMTSCSWCSTGESLGKFWIVAFRESMTAYTGGNFTWSTSASRALIVPLMSAVDGNDAADALDAINAVSSDDTTPEVCVFEMTSAKAVR